MVFTKEGIVQIWTKRGVNAPFGQTEPKDYVPDFTEDLYFGEAQVRGKLVHKVGLCQIDYFVTASIKNGFDHE